MNNKLVLIFLGIIAASFGANSMGEEDLSTTNIVERYAQAWLDGNIETIVASYHDGITLHWFGNNVLSGDHVGKEVALQALAQFSALSERKLVSIINVTTGPERSILIAREMLGKGAMRKEVERVLIYKVKDNLLFECWVYDQDQSFVDSIMGLKVVKTEGVNDD